MRLLTSRFTFFKSAENYVSDKTVLLIDNELDFCRVIRQTLEKEGFKVAVAHTFTLAKLQLDINDPYIIVMNQHLQDGAAKVFLAKNRPQLENKHVIIIRSDSSSSEKENLKTSADVDFLPKPFDLAVLSKMVYLAANFTGPDLPH